MANLRADNLCGTGFVSANDGTVWSDYVTSTTGSTLTNYPATYGFDGNLSNFVYADNNSTITWTPPNGGIKAGLIEVYVYAGNTHPLVRVNGKNTGAVVGSSTPDQRGNWVDVTDLVDGHLKTIEADGYTISSTARSSGWAAVRINGEILVDGEQGRTGGRESVNGSVYFDGEASHLKVLTTSDLALGTGDFTIETWVYFTSTGTYQSIIDFRESNGLFPFLVRDTDGDIYYYVNGSTLINNIPAREDNTWHHVAVVRSSGTTKIYLNGVEEGSASDSTNYVATNDPYIGGSTSFSNALHGYLSNLRITKSAVYTTNHFTPPTEKLKPIDNTVLLCCQDSENPTQEATGKEVIGVGACYYGKRYSNIATNGDFETGDTTGWTNGGCSTFEVSTDVVHSGTYSLHCISDGNGDHVYTTVSLNTKYRYKISAYINCVGPAGTSAKAKMKIGTSAAASTNYESQTANVGAGWQYVEWIGLPAASTTYITFNESSANNVNDWYVDDLRVEIWYPEETENILPNPNFLDGATGWSFSSTPSGEYTISSNRLNVADTSRTNDAFATVQLFYNTVKEGRYRVAIDYVLTSDDFDIGIGNNRIFGVAGGGTFSGAGNSASVTYEIEAGSGNSSLRLIANQHCVGYFNNIHLYRLAEPKRTNNPIPSVGVDAGVNFYGDTKVNSQNYMYFPTGDTSQRGRGRGAFAMTAAYPNTNNSISYIDIASQGIAKDFGDLTAAGRYGCGNSSATRGVSGGAIGRLQTMDYFTLASTGNAQSFGTLTYKNYSQASVANSTRIIWISGNNPDSSPESNINVMTYITTATKGNGTDFGDYTDGEKARYLGGNISSSTRGLAFGGYHDPNYTSNIDYVTIGTTGASQDFGDMSTVKSGCPGCSDTTRGVIFGGYNGAPASVNTIDMVTIATTGSTKDFGDLSATTEYGAACSNSIRGVHLAGGYPGTDNSMAYVTIQSTGNARDFGDLPTGETGGDSSENNNFSDSHGGVS